MAAQAAPGGVAGADPCLLLQIGNQGLDICRGLFCWDGPKGSIKFAGLAIW